MSEPIRLTQYSHGAGCGCKISPKVLDVILAGSGAQNLDPKLWVGNASRDDAAVYALDDERGVVSTTDFFMPIVDDPYDFGRIAATNAISDIYAMGGDPLMAIAILGWPVNLLPPEVAREVIRGGHAVCDEAGIPLAGGHSIDAPEPIFGLAVTGVVTKHHMKRNDTATLGCQLYLSKPLGIGILTTAEKKSKLRAEDVGLAHEAAHAAYPHLAPAVLAVFQRHQGMGRQSGPQGGGGRGPGVDRDLGVRGIEGAAAAGDDAAVDPGDAAFRVADLAPFRGLGDHLHRQARDLVFPQDPVIEARAETGPDLVGLQRQPARHGLAAGGRPAVGHGLARPGQGGRSNDAGEDGQSLETGASLARHRMRQ